MQIILFRTKNGCCPSVTASPNDITDAGQIRDMNPSHHFFLVVFLLRAAISKKTINHQLSINIIPSQPTRDTEKYFCTDKPIVACRKEDGEIQSKCLDSHQHSCSCFGYIVSSRIMTVRYEENHTHNSCCESDWLRARLCPLLAGVLKYHPYLRTP